MIYYHFSFLEDLFIIVPFFLCILLISFFSKKVWQTEANHLKKTFSKETRQEDSFLFYRNLILVLGPLLAIVCLILLLQIKFFFLIIAYLMTFGLLLLFQTLFRVIKNYKQEITFDRELVFDYLRLIVYLYPLFNWYTLNEMNSFFNQGMMNHPTLYMSFLMIWFTFRMIYILFGGITLILLFFSLFSQTTFYRKGKQKWNELGVSWNCFFHEKDFLNILFWYSKKHNKRGIFVLIEGVCELFLCAIIVIFLVLGSLISYVIKFLAQLVNEWKKQLLYNARLFLYKLFHYIILISFVYYYLIFLSSHLSEKFDLAMNLYLLLATVLIIPIILSKIQTFQEELKN